MRIFSSLVTGLFLSMVLNLHAQMAPVGQWKNHSAYSQAQQVVHTKDKIYCVTTGALFAVNLNDNSYETLSKVNGLSDVGVTGINYDSVSNTLIVSYQDANIDIIQNGVISNLPDIKIQPINGSKKINDIYFQSPLAYIACGFGIVVVDIQKLQTNETYYIGPGGVAENVRSIVSDGQSLYAGTDQGVFVAPLNSPNLNDFNSWTKQSGLPTGITYASFNTLAYFNGYVYANFSANISSNLWQQDVVYKFDGNSWSATNIANDNFRKLHVFNGNLVTVGQYSVNIYGTNDAIVPNTSNYATYGWVNAAPEDAYLDPQFTAWIADRNFGLIKMAANGITGEIHNPNGPKTPNVFSMNSSGGYVYSVPGGLQTYNIDGFMSYFNNQWQTAYGKQNNLNPPINMDTIHDLICVVADPFNPAHAYAGSDEHGVLEFMNGQFVKLYNPSNTGGVLRSQQVVSGYYRTEATGVDMDSLGNLYIANGQTKTPIVVLRPGGIWQGLDFSSIINYPITGQLMVSKLSNQVWINLTKSNSILTYNISQSNGGVFTPPSTANAKILTPGVGRGNLPGNVVTCFTEDKNGAIWVGTDQGITIFNNPAAIYNGGNFDAQQPVVTQNGYNQYLIQGEQVNAIAVDGANRKWVATATTGVYLLSSDGTSLVHHFSADNSPLISNNVLAVTINGKTGEVFFGTDHGIISYRGNATEGGSGFGKIYAFPNPVKHDYHGPISITGLAANSDVKITDLVGNLVYHTTALGGQATWNGTNFNAERVQTGIYLVFCTAPDGSKTEVTKILFIN